jgi:hypothetical protein
MGGWHVLSVLPIVLSGWLAHGLALGAALWLAFAVVGGVSAWVVVRGGGRSMTLPLTACPILLAGSTIGSFALPGGIFGTYNWPFAVMGWFGLVALWRQRLGALMALFTANVLIGVAALVVQGEAGPLGFARLIEQVCGVSILQVTIYVGSRAVAATARSGAEAADAASRTKVAEMAAEANRRTRRTRYEAIRETAIQLLQRMAAGQLDLADPGTRQLVAVSVTQLRSDLAEADDVQDLLLHTLRACADAARRRGIAVDLIPPAGTLPAVPAQARRALTEPIIHGLAAATAWARVTVVASAAEIIVAMVADTRWQVSLPEPHDGVEVNRDQEGEVLWIQARWPRACR